jgi:predicted nucleic-acid-binding Zn-ribbon protein|tara:strand:- start:12577 stop:12783 length:207 start_codon:yes stop_codon:yes gene_type:complete
MSNDCKMCGWGNLGITTRYVAKGEKLYNGWTKMPTYATKEHLVHRCTNCGYSWTSPTLEQIRDGEGIT